MQKLIYETKTQNLLKQKCWLYSILATIFATSVISLINILSHRQRPHLILDLSIIGIVLLYWFYRDFKIYFATKFRDKKSKKKFLTHSLLFAFLVGLLVVSIGKATVLKPFTIPTLVTTLIITPVFIFKWIFQGLCSYSKMDNRTKKTKVLSCSLALLATLIFVTYMTFFGRMVFGRALPSVFVFLIALGSLGIFVAFLRMFKPVNGKVFRKDTKPLIILLLIAGVGSLFMIGILISGVALK